jgi:hypothetical protein
MPTLPSSAVEHAVKRREGVAVELTLRGAAIADGAREWAPVVVLPSQVNQHSGQRRSPEMELVAAILEDALLSITRRADACRGRRRREFVDAWNWVWNDRRDWPFAFKNVCDLLALDASAVRRRVQQALWLRSPSRLSPPRSKRLSLPHR